MRLRVCGFLIRREFGFDWFAAGCWRIANLLVGLIWFGFVVLGFWCLC